VVAPLRRNLALHRARPDPDHKFAKKGFAAVAHHWFGALLKDAVVPACMARNGYPKARWQTLASVELFRRLPAADALLADLVHIVNRHHVHHLIYFVR
jgi:transposase InsO family protein